MKLLSLALVATVAVAGYTLAQTAAQAPAAAPAVPPAASKAPAASTPAASSSTTDSGHLGHECKEEVHKQCGRAHGQEMQACIKAALDQNKFSADCKTKLAASAKKPSG
jgi:hypothetical protein